MIPCIYIKCSMAKVALDAANEAFNTSAGRLRKLYAIEKLSGNLSLKWPTGTSKNFTVR
jgi:hypothetical protein